MAPPVIEKYNAFIVDSDPGSRMRLKSATSSVHQFGQVSLLNTLRDAHSKLELGDRCDVMFLSFRFEKAELQTFIQNAKGTRGGQDCAYVLVLESKNQDSQTVASTVLIGGDGFLFEPYSVDQLVEITRLAAKVRMDRSFNRERMALKIFLSNALHQIDLLAYLKSLGFEPGASTKKFREMCGMLRDLTPEAREAYYSLAVDTFEQAPLPKKSFRADNYKGVSSRVRRKMEDKIIAEAEAEIERLKNSGPIAE